jgi:hypothetical protein
MAEDDLPAERRWGTAARGSRASGSQVSREEGMLMSWQSWAAGALVAAGLVAGSPARAGDVFRPVLNGADAPAQTLALVGAADTITVGWHGHYHGHYHGFAHYRGYGYGHYHGYAYYRYPTYVYPRFRFSVGFGYSTPYYYCPPAYYYSVPSYYYAPISTGAEAYAPPGGGASYSVTRPYQPDAEPVMPPLPRDGTYRYDGGPDNPVPMPKAEPGPTSAPRYFYRAPADQLRVSVPAEAREVKEPAKGKFAYPAYGEEPRRTNFAADRATVVKDEKKNGR